MGLKQVPKHLEPQHQFVDAPWFKPMNIHEKSEFHYHQRWMHADDFLFNGIHRVFITWLVPLHFTWINKNLVLSVGFAQ